MKKIIYSIIALFLSFGLKSQEIPDAPNPPRLVNDFANILTPSQVNNLEDSLVAFNNLTSTQIVVVTISDIGTYDANEFANRLGETWKVGQKGFDNGIVILIKPKAGNERGLAAIQVGYGIEKLIPDALCRRIVDNEMIPQFKKGDYFAGIMAAIGVVKSLTKGEYTAQQYAKKKKAPTAGSAIVLFLLIFFLVILFSRSKGNRKTIGSNIPFWLGMGMMGSSFGHNSSGGGFGSFSSGSGGFGGFGGGSFGGGGASGSW